MNQNNAIANAKSFSKILGKTFEQKGSKRCYLVENVEAILETDSKDSWQVFCSAKSLNNDSLDSNLIEEINYFLGTFIQLN